jgi:hypothetical protein
VDGEEVLAGGVANAGAVVRVGGDVLRPSNANTASIHRFLTTLADAGFEGASEQRWTQAIREGVCAKEKEYARARAKVGRRALGVRGVISQRWWSRPKPNEPRRKMSPRVASTNKWKRIEALLENKYFLRAYREAREKLVAGIKNVLFPPGTYWLKRFAEVACDDSAMALAS